LLRFAWVNSFIISAKGINAEFIELLPIYDEVVVAGGNVQRRTEVLEVAYKVIFEMVNFKDEKTFCTFGLDEDFESVDLRAELSPPNLFGKLLRDKNEDLRNISPFMFDVPNIVAQLRLRRKLLFIINSLRIYVKQSFLPQKHIICS